MNRIKKIVVTLCAVLALGCSSTTANKSSDVAVNDVLSTDVETLTYATKQGRKFGEWMTMESDNEAGKKAYDDVVAYFSGKTLTPVEESEINSDNACFIFRGKDGGQIYFYTDGYLKSVKGADRAFYKLDDNSLATELSEAFAPKAAEE